METPKPDQAVRLAELIAALSLATDLGMGQPMEQGLRACLLSMRAARGLGLSDDTLSDVYYLALLRFIGCTGDAHEAAMAVGGDEIAFRAGVATVIMGDTPELMRHMVLNYAKDRPALQRLRLLAGAFAEGKQAPKRSIADHCEVAQMLAPHLGMRREIGLYIGCVFERWDGKGLPGDLAGEAIPLPARLVAIARDVDILERDGGWPLATTVLKQRQGKAYDPAITDVFLREGEGWLADLSSRPLWDCVLEEEPHDQPVVTAEKLDDVLVACAMFADLKSPYFLGHSLQVGALAEAAAKSIGLDDDAAEGLRRAGLIHDLGKVGIPNGIWDKPGPLSRAEHERVRLHPYLTERVVSQIPALAGLARLAGEHHERLDGGGYYRGSNAGGLSMAPRILAAADVYQALTREMPYRSALGAAERERELQQDVDAGRLDKSAVHAVLAVAGHAVAPPRTVWPQGLTDREVEILRLISRGRTKKAVAEELTISVKTVGRHVENIYGKIGVSSRAAAALFSMENGLL